MKCLTFFSEKKILPVCLLLNFLRVCRLFLPSRLKQIHPTSLDPDEIARNEPSHQDLHCLPFCV